MKRIFGLVILCLCATVSSAQNLLAVDAAANPCGNLGNPPTVGGCWDCFQSLLKDCDDKNPEGNRRNSCYTGANNFFTWCLGRVGGGNPVTPRPRSSTMNRGEGFSYQLSFENPVEPANIEVYVRDVEGGAIRSQQVNAFTSRNADGSISVFFDNNNLGLENDKTVGVVTIVRNPVTRNVEAAYAEAYTFAKGFYMTPFGLMDAWNAYANGEMEFDEFISFLNKYLAH